MFSATVCKGTLNVGGMCNDQFLHSVTHFLSVLPDCVMYTEWKQLENLDQPWETEQELPFNHTD